MYKSLCLFVVFIILICLQQMVFEGTIGNGFHGDIAVDDVSVTKGLCQLPGIVFEMLVWWGRGGDV